MRSGASAGSRSGGRYLRHRRRGLRRETAEGTRPREPVGPLDPGGTNVDGREGVQEQSNGAYVIKQTPGRQQRRRHARADRAPSRRGRQEHGHHQHGHHLHAGVRGGGMDDASSRAPSKEDALDDVLDGPTESVTWKDKVYGIPTNTNVQLLWYRKDLVPKPPETWDEMIEMAKKLPPVEGNILEQGQKYEGYVVWFNNLVASAGGEIVNAEGEPVLDEAAVKAATIIRDVARSGRADASLSTDAGGPVAARLRGRQGRLPAQLAVRLRRRARGRGDRRRSPRRSSRTWATPAGPGVNKGEPSKVSIGGANLGVPKTSQHPELAIEAALCMTSEKWQAPGGHQGRPAAGHEQGLRRRRGPQGLPVRRPAARAAQGLRSCARRPRPTRT